MTGFDKFAATGAAAESPIATSEKQGQLDVVWEQDVERQKQGGERGKQQCGCQHGQCGSRKRAAKLVGGIHLQQAQAQQQKFACLGRQGFQGFDFLSYVHVGQPERRGAYAWLKPQCCDAVAARGLRPLQNPHLWHISSPCASLMLENISIFSAHYAMLFLRCAQI